MYSLSIEDYKNILENAHDGILYTDRKGNILYCNQAYVDITKIDIIGGENDRNKIIGHNLRDYMKIGPYSNAAAIDAAKIKKPAISYHFYKDTSSFIAVSNPIMNSNGEVKAVVTIIKDTAEIIQFRTQLEDSEEAMDSYVRLFEGGAFEEQRGVIAVSDKMKQVFERAQRIKDVDTTVLICGESGSGKEVVAQYIHRTSRRKDMPIIVINCGALPEQLLETELFGYAPGTFTGGIKNGKKGLIEAADGGTLFLDEIGDITPAMQVKLLRFLEQREIVRVGGTEAIPVNVRIIAATNKNLEEMVRNKQFREDLYYRLNVVKFTVPPLRERKEDIIPTCLYYFSYFNAVYSMDKKISPSLLFELKNRDWPGNIRELKNMVERLVVTSLGDVIALSDLQYIDEGELSKPQPSYNEPSRPVYVNDIIPLKDAVEETEKQLLKKATEKYGSSRKVAEALGKDHSTIVRKLKKYGI